MFRLRSWALGGGGRGRSGGCGDDAPRTRPSAGVEAVDAGGRTVILPRPAARVISLVPSATDLLVAAGARGRLVGRTENDDAPQVAQLPSVGGMEPSLERIVSLRPDLVVVFHASASPRLRERIEAQGIPTFAMGTRDTAQTFAGLAALGRLTGGEAGAGALAVRMRRELAAASVPAARDTPSVFLVVNLDPPMTAGPGTFMVQVARAAGARTAFPELREDWATVSMEEVVRRQPDWLVVTTGAEGTREQRLASLRALPGWRELRAVREGRVTAVPARLLSRPGPGMGEAAARISRTIHPRP
jgi:ABC-type Fe3+-hydroxamate transport system substrate-binding protein